MTPDKPESQDLLKAAQDVMKSVLIPALPEEHRLDALMVLSIMAGDQGEAAQVLHAVLLEDVQDRLDLVNPKYLKAAG